MTVPIAWSAAPSLRDVDTSNACPDLGSHAFGSQRDHLMACESCWIRAMKMYAMVYDQIEERRWSASVGLSPDGHAAWSIADFV